MNKLKIPRNLISRGTVMTRVSPPTYLRWPSGILGRILPPWLHKTLILFWGEPEADPGTEPQLILSSIIIRPSVAIFQNEYEQIKENHPKIIHSVWNLWYVQHVQYKCYKRELRFRKQLARTWDEGMWGVLFFSFQRDWMGLMMVFSFYFSGCYVFIWKKQVFGWCGRKFSFYYSCTQHNWHHKFRPCSKDHSRDSTYSIISH